MLVTPLLLDQQLKDISLEDTLQTVTVLVT